MGIVADAAILAAGDPGSIGEAYNITNQGPITQREFLNLLAEAAGAPPVRRKVRYGVAYAFAFGFEVKGRLLRRRPLGRYAAWLMGRSLEYGTEEAQTRLERTPGLSYPESIGRRAMAGRSRERHGHWSNEPHPLRLSVAALRSFRSA